MGLAIFIFLLSSVLQCCVCRRLLGGSNTDAVSLPLLRSGGFPKFPIEDNSDNSILHLSAHHEGGTQLNCGRATVYHAPPKKIPLQAQTRIIGGSTAYYGAYPWQVTIQKYNRQDDGWDHHCGGTLVSDRHIIIAAHCLTARDHIQFRAVMGDHNLDVKDDWEELYAVDRWILHPDFQDAGPYSNDIGIIKLRRSVVMSSHVSPACLPTPDTRRSPGTWCVVSGWGLTEAEQLSSKATVLQAAAVPLVEDNLCKSEKYYGKQRIRPGMMCAGYEQGQIDACNNDSGGPLTCEINGQHILMGVVSWGMGCGESYKPGVYSDVIHYLDWIHKTMEDLKN